MRTLELTQDHALETPALDMKDALDRLASVPGVSFAALMDAQGFLIERAGHAAWDAEAVAALGSSLLESSEGIRRELGQGALRSSICEFDEGLLLALGGPPSRLVVVLHDVAALDAARRAANSVFTTLPCAP